MASVIGPCPLCESEGVEHPAQSLLVAGASCSNAQCILHIDYQDECNQHVRLEQWSRREGDHQMTKEIAKPIEQTVPETTWSRDLIKTIAMDIGKEVVAYIEIMYPQAVEATSSTFKLAVRNCIYNEIMASIDVNDAGNIEARLRDRKKFRREWTGVYRRMRAAKDVTTG